MKTTIIPVRHAQLRVYWPTSPVLDHLFPERSQQLVESIFSTDDLYQLTETPAAVLRLLGLFNGWNTIHYFSPNKALLALSWEKALPHFIPQFLTASTDSLYFMALMNLTGSLRDGHSILI